MWRISKLRFVAVQKLQEKKLVSEEGTLEIVTKITREHTSKNVSFNTHAKELDGESLPFQVWKSLFWSNPWHAFHKHVLKKIAWNMFLQLYEAWQSGSLVDFTLHCEGLSIPCHKIVLGARSDFFKGLLRCLFPDAASSDYQTCAVLSWKRPAGTLLWCRILTWTLSGSCWTIYILVMLIVLADSWPNSSIQERFVTLWRS